ncbi:hypothetical protein EJ02DRAFT_428887 [Clathrospora elynae]|uniref:Uncharacterized protein n=1 Tax=Clathrospora elynae TaxID=706981 RepID=A0A6A5S6C3_9PLEO|nr:hypothetical protein EJ02DRAFT_428887 [Clathrospora elynae]
MKATSFFSLGTLVAAVSAQTEVFEPTEFNITEALIANGFNVSAIPEPKGLTTYECSSLKLIYGGNKLLSTVVNK